jgi:hypothetical protein
MFKRVRLTTNLTNHTNWLFSLVCGGFRTRLPDLFVWFVTFVVQIRTFARSRWFSPRRG